MPGGAASPHETRGRPGACPTSHRRSALAILLAAVALVPAGCLGPMNIGSVRTDASIVHWQGYDHPAVDNSQVMGIEVARGKDTDPAFGPIYFGFAYSYARTEMPGHDDTIEQRFGTRWRSSVLEETTSSYPFAAVGVYGGWFEPGNRTTGKIGIGAEGGYGLRLGLGSHAAIDLDVMFSYGWYEGKYEVLSTRFGGALAARF